MPTPNSDSDDAALVAAARSGDDGAWAALVDRYQTALTATVRAMAGAEPWEDVTQEVWVQAHRDLHHLRADESFWPWLRQIAKRTVYRTTRRRRREQSSGGVEARLPAAASAESIVEVESESRRVWQAYDLLTGRDRDIIRYRFIEERSPAEVAALLQLTIDTVYTATQRARAAFAVAFERAALVLPPALVGMQRRWRLLLHGSPEGIAAVVASLALIAAPGLLELPRDSSQSSQHLDPAMTLKVWDSAITPGRPTAAAAAVAAVDSPRTAARPVADRAAPVAGDGGVGHQDVLRVDPIGRRVTTYDGDFDEHEEPDVRIGNDDTMAVRLWPYEQLAIDRPADVPPVAVDPTEPSQVPAG